MTTLPARSAAGIFVILAVGYFLSSVMRGVTSILAPELTQELALSASQLGLLAGAYFCGFATMQLPLGTWLDRYGPKRVLLWSLSIAFISCIAFSLANEFWTLLLARLLGGVGVSACLLAPLTGYRTWLEPRMQLRANSWMLMVGSLGLVAATLPVQWALSIMSWRLIFVILAGLFLVTMLGIAWQLPRWETRAMASHSAARSGGYGSIMRSSYFQRLAPLALINYGSLLAVQTLWLAPWMTRVAGYSAPQAAGGLFAINLTMLVVFWLWGALTPMLARAGLTSEQLMFWGVPVGVAALAGVAAAGEHAGWVTLAAYCALSSFVALTHPAVAVAFPAHEAGRALSAFNLLLFIGAFAWQWLIGVFIDLLRSWHWSEVAAYRAAFGMLAVCCALTYLWFAAGTHRASRRPRPAAES